jgi:hypothetical protein
VVKIALIEFGNSHDEVLYPQFKFLQNDAHIEVHIFASEALKPRLFKYPPAFLNFIPEKPSLGALKQLHHKLQALGITKVVINTASGKTVRNFLWVKPWSPLKYYGVLHHLKKLRGSSTQKLISLKLNRYYLLSRYLCEKAQSLKPKLSFDYFYAAFLPEAQKAFDLHKPQDQVWIVIPGQLEYKRRDYLGLIEQLKSGEFPTHLRFIALGKSHHSHGNGEDFNDRLQETQLQSYFKTWPHFVGPEEFYAYLALADYILPLIHLDHPSEDLYQSQISGAFNMAFAFRTPLLLEQSWQTKPEFKDAAYFYDHQNFAALWHNLLKSNKALRYQDSHWNIKQQRARFRRFLQLDS